MDRIEENVAFIIEKENSAWGYYHYLYLVTEKGNVFKCNKTFSFKEKTKKEIDEKVKTIEPQHIQFIKNIDVTDILEKCKHIKTDSKAYCTGVMFDAGTIGYYAFNTDISEIPILIGLRGNRQIHSENPYEEEIATWISEYISPFN